MELRERFPRGCERVRPCVQRLIQGVVKGGTAKEYEGRCCARPLEVALVSRRVKFLGESFLCREVVGDHHRRVLLSYGTLDHGRRCVLSVVIRCTAKSRCQRRVLDLQAIRHGAETY
jgi:hypothetical protein